MAHTVRIVTHHTSTAHLTYPPNRHAEINQLTTTTVWQILRVSNTKSSRVIMEGGVRNPNHRQFPSYATATSAKNSGGGDHKKRYDSIDGREYVYVIINMWEYMYGRDAVDAAQPDNHFYIHYTCMHSV